MTALPFATAVNPAVIVPIEFSSVAQAQETAATVIAEVSGADVLEWRVDALAGELVPDALAAVAGPVIAAARVRGIPLLATLRTTGEGGRAEVTEAAYEALLGCLLAQAPTAIDIEFERAATRQLVEQARKAGVYSVVSYHNFTRTPPVSWLQQRFAQMEALGADVAKIALTPQNRADVAALITALAQAQKLKVPIIGIAMGRLGAITRLAAGELGSAATFAAGPAGASAPGQYDVARVRKALDLFGA